MFVQDEEMKSDDRIVLAKPLQRFFLRGRPGRDNSVESVSFAKKNLEIDLPIESLNLINHRYSKFFLLGDKFSVRMRTIGHPGSSVSSTESFGNEFVHLHQIPQYEWLSFGDES